jgi:hypothetical protein
MNRTAQQLAVSIDCCSKLLLHDQIAKQLGLVVFAKAKGKIVANYPQRFKQQGMRRLSSGLEIADAIRSSSC